MNVSKRLAATALTAALLAGGAALAPPAQAGVSWAAAPAASPQAAKCKHVSGVGYYCGYYKGHATKSYGSSGSAVKEIQALLKYHWKTTAGKKLVVDGKFGSKTKAAVKSFQTQINKNQHPSPKLKVDGIVGSHTWWWLRY